jgi:thiopurine S-methyltransferase
MDHDFWHQRWQQDKIGFHLAETNPLLIKYQPDLGLSSGDEIFVPLCGKSQDMLWLREQGYQVVGIELSDLALKSFFENNNIPHRKLQAGEFNIYQSNGYRLYGGDFFALNAAVIQSCKLVYDRAALIAFPEEMRKQYVHHLLSIIPDNASIFLITLDYPQAQMTGPPFSVSKSEVETLFSDRYDLELLGEEDVLAGHEKFKQQGLTHLRESAYLLIPR